MTNEFLLTDRLQKIKQIITHYGEDNFYISFSGGKDSTVLSNLIDMALPDNQIPRVYADTGIELNMIRDFVFNMAKTDARVVVIKPSVPIKQMLDTHGYPFKSKEYSAIHNHYKKTGLTTHWVKQYLQCDGQKNKPDRYACPKILRYQFTEEFNLKISDNCCKELKEKPLKQWQKINNKPYEILGLIRSEGGRRNHAKCLAFSGNKLKAFQPLAIISKDWENWFISKYNIKICDIYKQPYNFERTGCKGCPFNPKLQQSLDILEKYFPNERKQCEIIWKPVYDEYRKIGYRLKKEDINNDNINK